MGDSNLFSSSDTAQVFAISSNKVEQVISHLKFLSKIRPGEKLNTSELFVRNNDSVFQRVIRTLRNVSSLVSAGTSSETKEATLEFIQATINEAIAIITVYRADKDQFRNNIADILVNNLEGSKIGIRNVISTYQNDRKFISQVAAIMQTLEARIQNLQKKGYMSGMTEASFMPEISDVE